MSIAANLNEARIKSVEITDEEIVAHLTRYL